MMEIISKNSYYFDNNQQEKRKPLYTKNAHTEMWMAHQQIFTSDNLNEFIERQTTRRTMLTNRGIQPRHYSSDFLFQEHSEKSIGCKVMVWVTWQNEEERQPKLVHTGYCDYEFIKTDDIWRISKRILHYDHKQPQTTTNI